MSAAVKAPVFALPAQSLVERARVALAACIDAATLAQQIGMMAVEEHGKDGSPAALAMKVLADRVEVLANGACQALGEAPSDIHALSSALFPSGLDAGVPEPFALAPSQHAEGAA